MTLFEMFLLWHLDINHNIITCQCLCHAFFIFCISILPTTLWSQDQSHQLTQLHSSFDHNPQSTHLLHLHPLITRSISAFTILTSVVWSCLFYGHFPDSLPDLLPCYRHHTVPQLSSVISLYPSAKTRSVISFCNMPIYLTSVILTIDSLLLSLPALFYIIMLPHYFFNEFSPVTVSNCWWRLQYRNREVVP